MKKRIYLSIIRKKSNLFLAFVISCIFIFSFISIAVYKGAEEGISEIEKTYGSSFRIQQMRDDSDASLWEEREYGNGLSLRVYVGPRVSIDMAEMIANTEGIEHWEPDLDMSVRPYNYKFFPGYYSYMEQYVKDNPESNRAKTWTEEDTLWIESMKYVTWEYPARDSTYSDEFLNGCFVLEGGRHIRPEDEGVVIVSKAFADLNDLEIGDTLIIDTNSLMVSTEYPAVSLGAVEVQIVGLFGLTYKQVVTDYTIESDIMENWLIVDMQTGMAILNIYGYDSDQWNRATFYVNDPSRVDEVMERVRDIDEIDWRYFYLEKDDTSYGDAIAPLNTMRMIMLAILAIVLAAGVTLIVLLISHAVKGRKRESGILMALGITATEIRRQIILEYLLIGLAAVILAVGISSYAAPVLGNGLLNTLAGDMEQKVYAQEEIEAAMAAGDTIKAIEMAQLQPQTASTPDSLDIQIRLWQILAVGATGLVIIGYSVNQVVQKTLRLSPRKALSMIE